ncbi:MAG TPA: ParB N-terminal domain-containing protein [Candidatus Agathobaculum pullicola]|nr:ParB N-terminal domain-containing protein [Candidatus Agathobaculum pullicola]
MAFSITSCLDPASLSAAPKKQNDIQRISYYDLVPSEDNFYSMEDIEELKAAIELAGHVLHNLVVTPLGDGKYKILSGHRRHRAVGELLKEGKDQYEFLPCAIEDMSSDGTGLIGQTLLIAANSQREKTAWDKLEEVRQMREIARRAKEQGGLPGRVRDLVAKSLHVSSSRIAKYDSILNNLLSELMVEIKADCLPISTAYELSTLESSEQLRQYAFFREHGKLPEKAAQSDVFHRNTQSTAAQPDEPAQPNVFHRNTQPVADQPDEPPQPDVFHQNTQPVTAQPDEPAQPNVFHRNTQPVTAQPDEPAQANVFHRNTQPAAAQSNESAQPDVFHRNTQPQAVQSDTSQYQIDIMQLTNNEKRKAVLAAWQEWPLWATVPEIGLTVHRLDLPDGSAFTASWYDGDDFYPGGGTRNVNRPRYHLIGAGDKLASGSQGESILIEHLQAMRQKRMIDANEPVRLHKGRFATDHQNNVQI